MGTLVLKPIHDRIIVKPIEAKVTPGGIHIPETAEGEQVRRGTVLTVGPGAPLPDGTVRPMQVRPRDTVLFGKYTGTTIRDGDVTLIVMREEDVLAVVDHTAA